MLNPCCKFLEVTLKGIGLAKSIVVAIVSDLHEVVGGELALKGISLMKFKLNTAGEGDWFTAIASHSLIPVLPANTVSCGEVEEGKHGGNIGVVSAVDS